MKKLLLTGSVGILMVLLVTSCSQEEDQIVLDQATERVLTSDQEQALNYYDETALLLTKLSQDRTVRDEVLGLALLNYEMTSGALFKHLLEPSSMPVPGRANQRLGTSTFASKFRSLIGTESSSKSSRSSAGQPRIPAATPEKYLLDNNVEIYWPYWQETAKMKEAPTITYDPITNADVNVGYKRSPDGSIETVEIDDDYAFAHPTWIVMQHPAVEPSSPIANAFSPTIEDIEERGLVNLIPIDCETDPSCPFNPNPKPKPKPPAPVDGSAKYNKLYIHDVKLDGNFRGLFGGDNDVEFFMADEKTININSSGELVANGSKRSVAVRVDRYAGRKKKWRRFNALLDDNWRDYETEPAFAVYGRQVKSSGLQISSTVEGKFKYDFNKKKFSVDGKPSNVDISFTKTDRLLSVLAYERGQFFLENLRNADGHGTYSGLAIRKSGSGERATVYHTYRIQAYN